MCKNVQIQIQGDVHLNTSKFQFSQAILQYINILHDADIVDDVESKLSKLLVVFAHIFYNSNY